MSVFTNVFLVIGRFDYEGSDVLEAHTSLTGAEYSIGPRGLDLLREKYGNYDSYVIEKLEVIDP